MTAALLLALKISVVVLTLSVGLGSTVADLTYLWRRPALLAKSLAAMYLAAPLVALAVAKLLPLPPAVETAILVLAVSAGAPLLPKKVMKLGRDGYAFSLVVTSSLLAVLVVPTWVALLRPLFGRQMSVDPRAVALVIAKAILAPLLVGMLLRRWPFAKIRERLSRAILRIGGSVLIASGVGLLALHGRLILAAGWTTIVALVAVTAASLAVGHLLGGPDAGERTALAVSCATRHVGIAMLAAATVPGPKTIAFVLAYALASVAVSLPYLRWRGRLAAASMPQNSGTPSADAHEATAPVPIPNTGVRPFRPDGTSR